MTSHTADDIIFTELPGVSGSVGKITLNRPQALNAMTTQMCRRAYDQLQEWAVRSDIKAVVIVAAGERAFCAGGDIRFFYEVGPAGLEQSRTFFWHEYRMNHTIFHFPKPYIAMMQGITMGGGVGASIHGSHRIAGENFQFAMPEVAIGLHPDIGSGYFLTRCLGRIGFYLGLTGNRIHAADAQYAGIIDATLPQAQFENFITALTETALGSDPDAAVTELIEQFHPLTGTPSLAAHRVAIDHAFSLPTVEAIIEQLRQQNTPWAEQTVTELLQKSPTSLKITLHKLRDCQAFDFAQWLQLDFRLTLRILEHREFYEGIRAAIIDKDRSPRWQPATLAGVSDEAVASYFVPLEHELEFG